MSDEKGWRVGRHQPRNIYADGQFVLVALGPDDEAAALAAHVCATMNALADIVAEDQA